MKFELFFHVLVLLCEFCQFLLEGQRAFTDLILEVIVYRLLIFLKLSENVVCFESFYSKLFLESLYLLSEVVDDYFRFGKFLFSFFADLNDAFVFSLQLLVH